MISLQQKTEEALERTRRFSLGEDVEFPKVVMHRMITLFYCDVCGNQFTKKYKGYFYCECE